MALSPAPLPDLANRMLLVKRQALTLFFGGGAFMALLALFLPTTFAPDPGLGRLLFGVVFVVSLAQTLLMWRRPQVLRDERYDWLFMWLGNGCVALSAAAETLTFNTQHSAMVVLWPMVFAAGFLSRRLFWWQAFAGLVCMVFMGYLNARYITHERAWLVGVVMLVIPVVFTGLSIAFFRQTADHEAQELAQMVRIDPLTGLSNRRELPQQFGEWLERAPAGAAIALVMLDLDHFKAVNDVYGHLVGDTVLQDFARLLREHAQPSDLTARLGGEEFMWITTAQDARELLFRVERLRQNFEQLAAEKKATVSAGVALWPQPTPAQPAALTGMMKAADQALYRAKREGRNRVCLENWLPYEEEIV